MKASLSFSHWKQLAKKSFRAFPALWWRISAVNLLAILTLLVGTGIFAGIGYMAFLQDIENFLANLTFGGAWQKFVPVILLIIVWAVFIFVFSLNGKTAVWLTVKTYVAKKKRNPFKLYYKDSWNYFMRYVSVILRSLWYIGWPVIVVMGLVFLAGMKLPESQYLQWGETGGMVIAGILGVWRGVRLLVVREMLIHYNKSAQGTFLSALKVSRGHWWGILLHFICFFTLINIVRIPLLFLMNEQKYSSGVVEAVSLVDFLLSFFVLAPLLISFLYFLMLSLTKGKK